MVSNSSATQQVNNNNNNNIYRAYDLSHPFSLTHAKHIQQTSTQDFLYMTNKSCKVSNLT